VEANKQILNANLKHKVFGIGTVKEINGNMIIINFVEKGDKKFTYPDAFDNFLNLSDPILEEMVAADVKRNKDEVAAEKALIKQKLEDELQTKVNVNKSNKKKTSTRKTKEQS
jgi:alpha-acetolactate decarboxylase